MSHAVDAKPTALSAAATCWRELVSDNPMLLEGKRETRRMFRASSNFGRFGPAIMIFIIGFAYLWLLLESVLGKVDSSTGYIYMELVLVTLFLPGSIYGAISGEREKATWEALILTRLTPAQIVSGKLLWRMRLLAAIMVALIIPVMASRSFANSLDCPLANLVRSQILVALWGVLLCTFGLWVSSMTRRSIASLTAIAITVLGLVLVLPSLYAMFSSMWTVSFNGNQHDPFMDFLNSLNPFVLLTNILSNDSFTRDGAWLTDNSGTMACIGYAVAIVVLLIATHRRLKRLENPESKSGR